MPTAATLELFLLDERRTFPPFETEYRFARSVGRKYRFDYAFPEQKLAVEVEGGVFTGQAHGSITGIKRDIEKYSLAAVLGWRVIRVLPEHVEDGTAIEWIEQALGRE